MSSVASWRGSGADIDAALIGRFLPRGVDALTQDASPIALHTRFPRATFAPPATEAQVVAVETALGVRLPEQLRRLYFECDGFREDRGAVSFLHPLAGSGAAGSLLEGTRFFWEDHPGWPDLRSFVFFGRSGGDDNWGINWKKPSEIIAYSHHMMDEFEVVGSDILEVLANDYAEYDKLP